MKKNLWRGLLIALIGIVMAGMSFGAPEAVSAAGGGGGDGGGAQTLDVNDVSIISGSGSLSAPIVLKGGTVSLKVVTGGLVNRWSNMEADVKTYASQIKVQTEAGETAGSAAFGAYYTADQNKTDPTQPFYTVLLSAANGEFAPGGYKVIFPAGYPVKGNPSATDKATETKCTLHFALAKDISGMKATAAASVYNGKAKKPAIRIAGLTAANYTVTYPSAIKTGRYKATVKGASPYYTGTKTISFTIKPAKGRLKSVKPGKKKITVKPVSQKTSGITGYQILYKKTGTKSWKKTTLAASKTSKVIKKLKKGKKYSVKIRGYKKTSAGTLYGAYSAVKTVKVK